jgi:hypothetical protein
MVTDDHPQNEQLQVLIALREAQAAIDRAQEGMDALVDARDRLIVRGAELRITQRAMAAAITKEHGRIHQILRDRKSAA